MGVSVRAGSPALMTESMTSRLALLRSAIEQLADRPPRGRTLDGSGEPDQKQFAFPTLSADFCDPDAVADLAARASKLGVWSQGPFRLGETLVLGGEASDDARWSELDWHIGSMTVGARAIVVGCGPGFDAFALVARGATDVLAIEPSEAIRQAELLESAYRSGASFRRAGWDDLDAARDGRFEIVLCDGLIHKVLEPMAVLRRLHDLTAAGGVLVLGATMLSEPERSEFLRFVPGRHAGDPEHGSSLDDSRCAGCFGPRAFKSRQSSASGKGRVTASRCSART